MRAKDVAREAKALRAKNREEFYRLKSEFPTIQHPTTRAAAFFILNHLSYTGIGGYSAWRQNLFKAEYFLALETFSSQNFFVEHSDFEDVLAKHSHRFAYCDPPYVLKSKLYGKNGVLQDTFDHHRLASVLKRRSAPWLLSYNDCQLVRELYADCEIKTVEWTYHMKKPAVARSNESNEVLIFSKNYPQQTWELYTPQSLFRDYESQQFSNSPNHAYSNLSS